MTRRRRTLPAIAALAALAAPGAARGQVPTAGGERASLALSGYVRSLTGIHDAGFDVPLTRRVTGFHGDVVRLRWSLGLGERVSLVVHNRLQVQVTSSDSGAAATAGFGVSVVPGRPVDLTTRFVDQPRLDAWHDVDRLALTVRTRIADVTVGRQAITWGTSSIFPVADLWAQFSPFELDTEEKPGADAVRVLGYPWPGVELDAVAAARGRADDWSAALRASVDMAAADAWAAAGKFWNETIAMGGLVLVLRRVKLRAEAALPYDLDSGRWQRPRATLGADWLGARLVLTAEYHHNGLGAREAGAYPATLASPQLARGESYYLGRDYLGGALAWTADEEARLSLAASALWNVRDASAVVTPVASYQFGQATTVSAGAVQSFGRAPALSPPAFRSEFGAYGDLWFIRVSVYF